MGQFPNLVIWLTFILDTCGVEVMILMHIRFDLGNQSPYLVIWFAFVVYCGQDDAMTMLAQICRSVTTYRNSARLLLQSTYP